MSTALILSLLPAVAFGGFRASSFKKETRGNANTWASGSALDNDMSTCWMVDPESENKGEWIEIDVPQGEVDKIGMVIGWGKSAQSFTDYARIKSARVQVISMGGDEEKQVLEHDITFEDASDWQVIDIPDTKVGDEMSGGKVRITVTDFYEGEDFPMLAVSEVLVHMKEAEVPSPKLVDAEIPTAEGFKTESLFDDNARTAWVSEGEQVSLQVEAMGFGLSGFGIASGPRTYARPKTVVVVVGLNAQTVTLEDKPGAVQWISLPAVIGYTGSVWEPVEFKVVDTYPGTKPGVGIGEIKLKYTNYDL